MIVTNPATGEPAGEVPDDDVASLHQKVAAARRAQSAWADLAIGERIEMLRRFRMEVSYRADDLAATLTAEMGKPVWQSRNELAGLLPRIDYFLDTVEEAVADDVVHLAGDDTEEVISYEPLGVVANISAWNYPWFVGSNVWVPALLTGNAVVYKPSELTPLTGRHAAELLWGAGVPEDVFALLIGDGQIGSALVENPGVDGVFFTGSYATGARIAKGVASRMVPLQLELGGKDPVYVCDDVDVEIVAASLAEGAFYNAGQSCCSVERIYVHEDVAAAFEDALVTAVERLVVGDPLHDDTYIGPLTRSAQLDVLDAQVQDARSKGAVVRVGGHRVDGVGNWYAPTVVTGADETMTLMRDESFGPIIGVQRVADDDDALERMNDTEYGLTAGVYTRDELRATALLRRVSSGSAYWNCCDRVSPRLPWSGRGHSGVGSTLGVAGIRAFTRPKAWHLRAPQ